VSGTVVQIAELVPIVTLGLLLGNLKPMKIWKHSSVLFFLALVAGYAAEPEPKDPAPHLLVCADFEGGDLSGLKRHQAAEDALTVVTSPVRAGHFAVKILLRATDPKVAQGQRAEFYDRTATIEMNKDYWYGLSIFVPEDFASPTKSTAIFFQWHTQRSLGEAPVLAIRVKRDQWLITDMERRSLATAPLKKGVWTDWVVHVRWASKATGFRAVWKDGVQVLNESDVVTQQPEEIGPYVKFGQYHSVDEAPRNVIFVDEYRVAGPDGTYESVSPPRTKK
jgi:hypothetical protein